MNGVCSKVAAYGKGGGGVAGSDAVAAAAAVQMEAGGVRMPWAIQVFTRPRSCDPSSGHPPPLAAASLATVLGSGWGRVNTVGQRK